jgi:hypothetical protein
MAKIEFENKVSTRTLNVALNKKITAENINEIKTSVNWLYDNVVTLDSEIFHVTTAQLSDWGSDGTRDILLIDDTDLPSGHFRIIDHAFIKAKGSPTQDFIDNYSGATIGKNYPVQYGIIDNPDLLFQLNSGVDGGGSIVFQLDLQDAERVVNLTNNGSVYDAGTLEFYIRIDSHIVDLSNMLNL